MKKFIRPDIIGYYIFNNARSEQSPSLPQYPFRVNTNTLQLVSSQSLTTIGNVSLIISGDITNVLDAEFSLAAYRHRIHELVYGLYKKHGGQCSEFLEGLFSIYLYDATKKECFIFNNRYQSTGVYYYTTDSYCVFSSSLKLLLSALGHDVVFDVTSIPSFLRTGFSYTEKTQFKNIFRLLPTFYLHCTPDTHAVCNHWGNEYTFNRKPIEDVEKKVDEYETLFRASIKNYLDSVKPDSLGCLLSGGHDTSYIFLQSAQLFHKPVHAFTGTFEHFGFDESPKARFVTDRFGGIHHKVLVGEKALDLLPLMTRVLEEPLSGGAFPIFCCMREAAKYCDCVFTGDAGDTLWGEYYPVSEWHRYMRHIPHWLRKGMFSLNNVLRGMTDWERLWESEHVFRLFAQKDMYADFFGRLCTYRHYNADWMRSLLDTSLFPSIEGNSCMFDIPFTKETLFDTLVEAKMFYGMHPYMQPPGQRSLEAWGARYFAPYYNRELITFINSLPQEWLNGGSSLSKLTNNAHKRLLHKKALLRYLPQQYVYSAQQSFDVPFHSFLTKRPEVLTRLCKSLKKRGWFNEKTLNKLFEEFPKQKVKPHELHELKHHGYRIFCLLTLEVWYREFFELRNEVRTITDTPMPLEEYLT